MGSYMDKFFYGWWSACIKPSFTRYSDEPKERLRKRLATKVSRHLLKTADKQWPRHDKNWRLTSWKYPRIALAAKTLRLATVWGCDLKFHNNLTYIFDSYNSSLLASGSLSGWSGGRGWGGDIIKDTKSCSVLSPSYSTTKAPNL